MKAQWIDKAEAQDIQERSDVYESWAVQYRQKNGWTVIPADAVPPVSITNEERGRLEQFLFATNPPARYFLYINEERKVATTWVGDILGRVTFGRAWQDNFGGKRIAVRIEGINGRTYTGTYFQSSGQYARVRLLKNSR